MSVLDGGTSSLRKKRTSVPTSSISSHMRVRSPRGRTSRHNSRAVSTPCPVWETPSAVLLVRHELLFSLFLSCSRLDSLGTVLSRTPRLPRIPVRLCVCGGWETQGLYLKKTQDNRLSFNVCFLFLRILVGSLVQFGPENHMTEGSVTLSKDISFVTKQQNK